MLTPNSPEIDLDELSRGTRRAINNIRARIAGLRWVVVEEERIVSKPGEANLATHVRETAHSDDSLHQKS